MILPKIVYSSGTSGDTTLNFSYPPVQKPGTDDLEARREDSITLSGKKQSQWIRNDEFLNLQMDYVPQEDLADWAAFLDYALPGNSFDYYPDATSSTHATYILEDTTWIPKYAFHGFAKFTLRFRLFEAVHSAIGTILSEEASGTVRYSIGFRPKAVLFFMHAASTDGFSPTAHIGFGFAADNPPPVVPDGDNMTTFIKRHDGSSTPEFSLTSSLAIERANDVNVGIAYIAHDIAFHDDGFSLTWQVFSGGATPEKITYIALSDRDLSNAGCGIYHWAASSSGSTAITNVGFQPDLVLFVQSFADGGGICWSAADSNNQWAIALHADGYPDDVSAHTLQRTDSCWLHIDSDGTEGARASLSSLDSDGFTVNVETAPSASTIVGYLALKGSLSWAIGSFLKTTGAAPASQNVALDFEPTAAILCTSGRAASTSVQDDMRVSLGLAEASAQAASWAEIKNGTASADAEANKYFSETAAVILAESPSTEDAEGSVAMTANGMTVSWDPNDATAAEVCYLAFKTTV